MVVVVPAVLVLLVQLAIPSLQTLALGVVGPLGDGGRFGGPQGGAALRLAARDLPVALGSGLTMIVAPWLISIVLGAGLALAARGPRGLAIAGRAVTGLLVASYAPVVVAVSILLAGRGRSTDSLPWLLSAAVLTPVLTGVHAAIVAAILRRGGRTGRTLVVAGMISATTAIAVGLQGFVVPYLSGFRPGRSSAALLGYFYAFSRYQLTVAGLIFTVVLVVCGGLGIVAVVLLVSSRTRLSLTGPRETTAGSVGAGIAGLVVGVLAIAAAIATFVPYLAAAGGAAPTSDQGQVTSSLLRMWGLSLPTALVQLVVTGAAAIGIGWLRPFGPNSRRLLLIFAPWLLVAPVTLSAVRFDTMRTLGMLDTPVALLPATLVSVPALVVLTLLADGLRDQRDAGMPLRTVVAPAVGIAALLTGALWVGAANDVVWPLILTTDRDSYPGTLVILQALGTNRRVPFAAALPVPLLLIMVAGSAVLHATTLGRVGLTGR